MTKTPSNKTANLVDMGLMFRDQDRTMRKRSQTTVATRELDDARKHALCCHLVAAGLMVEDALGKFLITRDGKLAAQMLRACKPPDIKVQQARNYLINTLTGKAVAQKWIEAEGARRGFSRYQLKRAKRAVGARAIKTGTFRGPWFWTLR